MNQLAASINHAFDKLKSPKFLQKEGLGGEIPFFIFPYKIKCEPHIDKEVSILIRRLEGEGVRILELNLYDISIAILEENGGIDKMFRLEERQKKRPSYFMKALQSALNLHEAFIPYIQEQIKVTPHDLVFITGVAPVFPYMRSHVVLNNLHSVTDHVPTVMFYPGEYTGSSLQLFDLLKSNNYYRAYNLNEYQL